MSDEHLMTPLAPSGVRVVSAAEYQALARALETCGMELSRKHVAAGFSDEITVDNASYLIAVLLSASKALAAPRQQTVPAELVALSEKATPGEAYTCGLPWFQSASGVMVGSPDPHAGYMIADTEVWDGEREEARENGRPALADGEDDAAFLAACWNYVRRLITPNQASPASETEGGA